MYNTAGMLIDGTEINSEQESAESPERTDYDSSLLSAEKRVKAVFFMIQLMKQQQVPLY